MKPESTIPSINLENIPQQNRPNPETLPIQEGAEAVVESGAESFEQKSELSAIMSDVGLATTLPTPVADTGTVVPATTLGANPLVANDDDLIEKEWVDKAKKIVASTQNDPHRRENEVSKLQVDYIKKRYGRELGVVE